MNGEFHGFGKLTSPGGESYDGHWKKGIYNGNGTYIFGAGKWKGDKYEGEYKDGKKEGEGIYTFSDGKKYIGSFKNGKMHGQGILNMPSGNTYEGKWDNGKYLNKNSYEKDDYKTKENVNQVKQIFVDKTE